MRVIGTAGHVDHGKSTLVQALTGTHPDRLKEEQEREMTIDLGFAYLKLPPGSALPDGEEIGIVDVPGHRDFIENMLAGIGGIDAVLFVVAADEGVMPQTREHLAILDLLQISDGVIALTKVDMINDPEWLDLVEEEIRSVAEGTVLEAAPIVAVSGRTGQGIPELMVALSECLARRAPRPDLGRPRLPVDRVFTIAGFGTVVTGTLSDGALEVGAEVVIWPQGLHGRIRGIQSHNQKREIAVPGSRTAVNIAGVDVGQIRRGDVVALPGHYEPTRRLDVEFRMLPDVGVMLRHNMEAKFFIGAAEVLARVRLLGRQELREGEAGWLQLELNRSVVAVRGDRYILRRPSPGMTLGGGAVIDPHPGRRHKRFAEPILQRLESLARGTPAEILIQAVDQIGAAPIREAVKNSHLEFDRVAEILPALLETGELILLDEAPVDPMGTALVSTPAYWARLAERILSTVQSFHERYPLRRGLPKEELRSRLKISPKILGSAVQVLAREQRLKEDGPLVSLPDHAIRFNPEQQKAVDRLLAQFAAQPAAPPTVKECLAAVSPDVYEALVELGALVPVSTDVVYRREDFDGIVADLREALTGDNTISVAAFRDRYGTSRRYALAFLEYLDEQGVTIREGDVRRLRQLPGSPVGSS